MQRIKLEKKHLVLLFSVVFISFLYIFYKAFYHLYFKKVYVVKLEDIISYDNFDLDALAEFIKNSDADGYIFYVNSPGGYLESYKIIEALKSSNKTSVCYIKKYGASAAYWLCSQTDYIVAEPFAITGSVGGIIEYLNFAGLLKKLGITPVIVKEGELKDLGNPYRNITNEELRILQSKLKLFVNKFREDVLSKRNVTNISKVLSGEWFFGIEALKLGLVDELGSYSDAKKAIARLLNTSENRIIFVEISFEKKESFLDKLIKTSLKTIVEEAQKITII